VSLAETLGYMWPWTVLGFGCDSKSNRLVCCRI